MHVLQGSLLHEVIENQIGQHHLGRDMNETGAKSQYTQRLGQYKDTARDVLTEFYNGIPYDDLFFERIRDEGLLKLDMFFGVIWPQFQDLEYLKHEEFDKFFIDDIEVVVKVDYVSKTKPDVIVITDWKTGADDEEYENDLQIATYFLWAMQYYKKAPSHIRSELAYLKTGAMRPYEFTFDDLDIIQGKIVDEYCMMNKSYEIVNFPPNPTPRKCIGCQFGTLCPASEVREFLYSG